MTEATDVFTPAECYLLLAPFDTRHIFGMPDKLVYTIQEEVFEIAIEQLQAKKIITAENEWTKTGIAIAESFKIYNQSKKFVRLNQFMFALTEDHEELLALVEITADQEYKLLRLDKMSALNMLLEAFEIIGREPEEEEKTFLQKKLSNKMDERVQSYPIPEEILNIEIFNLDAEPKETANPSFHQHYLYFLAEEALIMIDIEHETYYQSSQYALLKRIFDELAIPYEQEVK